ncbi:MAG: hypothetical protein IAE67_07485 [Candidatus Competibacteraceae bacterium]|nr:hypothetical protein [Candidatus Competibacteraceae bacterium]
MKTKFLSMLWVLMLSIQILNAQNYYNRLAGVNAPTIEATDHTGEFIRDESGNIKREAVKKDHHGNAQGNQYDLAIDGAFEGQTIVVLQLYHEDRFDFELPKAALKEKGFSVYRYISNPPSAQQLKKDLDKACQLWIISDSYSKLNDEHLAVIKKFFDSGRGVYIWGDNEPYYADANRLAKHLIGAEMNGNLLGDREVGLQENLLSPGLRPNHLITTGLEFVYEGITIATLNEHQHLDPLIYGSAGNLVTAAYEKNGKRLILDGGFTRLYIKWDTAGTGRYVKNAAAWLVNVERFGEELGKK